LIGQLRNDRWELVVVKTDTGITSVEKIMNAVEKSSHRYTGEEIK
jgi:hypothetical protein